MSAAIESIGVIGAGAWGTALALVAERAGRAVTLWAREADVEEAIRTKRENTLFLPGVPIPAGIAVTAALEEAAQADALLLVTPAQFLRGAAEALRPVLTPGTPVMLCAKGVERGSLKLMTEVLAEACPAALPAVLSGPSFAADVAKGLPTAVTLACADQDAGARLAAAIAAPAFRPYLSADPVGAELGGAVKNVLAIACGIVEGQALGDSARAALITRGFAEIQRLGQKLGAQSETLHGLSGLGDLILTCSSRQSRNYSLGLALGRGESLEAILSARTSVAEGVASADAVAALAAREGVEMPITAAVAAIVAGQLQISEAIQGLLSRPLKQETV